MAGRSFTPIGTPGASEFIGVLDGNGHVVENLAIATSGNFIGLFGAAEATIKNLGITNVNVSGGTYVGGGW